MKSKINEAEKQRYDKIKRIVALLCCDSKLVEIVAENSSDQHFKTGRRIIVDGEIIRIKNKAYEARQLQKIIINTEGSMRIYDRYGKKLCGSMTLNSSSANVERFCIWARKYKIPAEVVSGVSERFLLVFFSGLVTLVIAIVKLLTHIL